MINSTFGNYISDLRKANNLTLTKLAASLDIDQSTLSKIENNKRNVPDELIPKIASVFNLDVRELYKEFYSEKIAFMIYSNPQSDNILELAEKKVEYFKNKRIKQGTLNI